MPIARARLYSYLPTVFPGIVVTSTGVVYEAATKKKIGVVKRREIFPVTDSPEKHLQIIIELFEYPINTELPEEEKELADILDQSRSIEVLDEK